MPDRRCQPAANGPTPGLGLHGMLPRCRRMRHRQPGQHPCPLGARGALAKVESGGTAVPPATPLPGGATPPRPPVRKPCHEGWRKDARSRHDKRACARTASLAPTGLAASKACMSLSPIWRDFVGDGRFNSPPMTLMRQITTDFYGKRWRLVEKSAEIYFIRVICAHSNLPCGDPDL